MPHDIIYRKKQGFAAPVAEWLRKEWYPFAENKLMNSSLVKMELSIKDMFQTY